MAGWAHKSLFSTKFDHQCSRSATRIINIGAGPQVLCGIETVEVYYAHVTLNKGTVIAFIYSLYVKYCAR